MNVVRNDFVAKKKRLRNLKSLKSNLPRFYTVSNGLSFPRASGFLRLQNQHKTHLNISEVCSSISMQYSVSEQTLKQHTSFAYQTEEEIEINCSKQFGKADISAGAVFPTDSTSESSAKKFEEIIIPFRSRQNVSPFTHIFCEENNFPETNSVEPEEVKEPIQALKRSRSLFRPLGTPSSTLEESHGSMNLTRQFFSSDDITVENITTSSRSTRTPITHSSSLRERSNSSRRKMFFERKIPSSRGTRSSRTPGVGRDFDSGAYILAVTEGRGQARGEVGIAAIDPRRPNLVLCQISDNQRYVHTLTKMNVFDFKEVIVPNTFTDGSCHSKLYTDIGECFPGVTLTSIQRRHFNEAVGLELINEFSSPESGPIMVLIRDKRFFRFYALSSAAALIKYVEFTHNILFASRSVKVEYQGTEDTMIIDLDTANRLELVTSKTKIESNFNNTLFGVLKHCHTKGGIRLLRANILQPPCLLTKIETRLDCVSELIQKPMVFFSLEAAVSNFANVENLLALCMHEPQQEGLRAAESQLKYVLLLKSMLEFVPTLMSALKDTTSDYFCDVRQNLEDARFRLILDRILETVSESAKTVKGSVAAHLHGCFAVKTGINCLLDVAKKTYCEIVQEIWDHVNVLREKYDLPLKMSFSTQRGFHIQYTLPTGEKNVSSNDLPKQFILIQKSKSTFSFYTSELVALDQRSQHVLNEIKLITNVIFFELLIDIRRHIGCLFNLCEYIAELDVILSFAHIGSGQNFVRPRFGNELHVIESRHPILDVIHEGVVVPNDIFAEQNENFIILTGPNQSGKSIYIRQIALLQIMAQIGCFVPAKEATFRIADRLFSRIGFDDSAETNASTLIVEMRDIDYLRQNITDNSLVIIDELCRGTSVDEGTSLAFTICEEFLDSSAFVFLTTHYVLLTKLEEMYFNVKNYHFESELVKSGEDKFTLRFTHKKLPGVAKAEQYGLQVAETTAFPRDILAHAKVIAAKLLKEKKPIPEAKGLSSAYKLSEELRTELVAKRPNQISSKILRFKNLLLEFSTDDLDGATSEQENEDINSQDTEKGVVLDESPIQNMFFDFNFCSADGHKPLTNDSAELSLKQSPVNRSVSDGLHKENYLTFFLCHKIKRKYRHLRMLRAHYQLLREELCKNGRGVFSSATVK